MCVSVIEAIKEAASKPMTLAELIPYMYTVWTLLQYSKNNLYHM